MTHKPDAAEAMVAKLLPVFGSSDKKPRIVDAATGVAREVELFVGVLGASNLTYAEAVPSQRLEDWIGAHVRMLEFFGGVPQQLVPDQLRSAVSTPSRYEPVIQRTYADLARHYGTAVVPARPGKPRDKGWPPPMLRARPRTRPKTRPKQIRNSLLPL